MFTKSSFLSPIYIIVYISSSLIITSLSLSRENAIDRLINLYKKTVYKTNGWLTNSGEVYLDRVQLIMADLGDAEDEIFKKRQQDDIAFR